MRHVTLVDLSNVLFRISFSLFCLKRVVECALSVVLLIGSTCIVLSKFADAHGTIRFLFYLGREQVLDD
jgi:hypothetical protein